MKGCLSSGRTGSILHSWAIYNLLFLWIKICRSVKKLKSCNNQNTLHYATEHTLVIDKKHQVSDSNLWDSRQGIFLIKIQPILGISPNDIIF